MSLKRVPTWLKIFLLLIVCSFVFSALGAISIYWVGPFIFIGLALFPGKNLNKPRIFSVIPWLWAMSAAESIVMIGAMAMGKNLLPPEVRAPGLIELSVSAVLSPILMFAVWKRWKFLKLLLIGASLVGVILGFYVYLDQGSSLEAKVELGATLTECLTIAAAMIPKVSIYLNSADEI